MKLAQFSVNRPVTTVMIFVAAIVLGLMSLTLLGIDLMPAVRVLTTYEGAGPEAREIMDIVRQMRQKVGSEGIKAFMWQIEDIT